MLPCLKADLKHTHGTNYTISVDFLAQRSEPISFAKKHTRSSTLRLPAKSSGLQCCCHTPEVLNTHEAKKRATNTFKSTTLQVMHDYFGC